MNLDERIIDRKYIFDCFSVDKAKEYIGENCYMTDDFPLFEDLDFVQVYKLDAIEDSSLFCNVKEDKSFDYCLPVRFVKPAEKKYRPFADTREFFIKTNFEVGDLIHIRSKPHNHEYHLLIIGWTDEGLMLGNFSEMTFDELFDKFELWDGEDNFIPFGVANE